MIPSTAQRVPLHTADHVNEEIWRSTQQRIAACARAGPQAIGRRLQEIDREWDVERMLEANAASATLLGVLLGATVNRKFFYFPAIIGGFLLQHAIQGWCPPLPLFRRLGFRTQTEIEAERHALRDLLTSPAALASSEAGPDIVEVTEIIMEQDAR